MQIEDSPKLRLLRMLLAFDATLLFLLGVLFMTMPAWVERVFHFQNLPVGVGYIIGSWGCVFATLAAGYIIAAKDPVRNVAWVQVGIARGALECVFGFICITRGMVTWEQAVPGIAAAAIITCAYTLLYPSRL